MISEANFIGTIKKEGRVTVPEPIRKALHLEPNALVQITIKKVR